MMKCTVLTRIQLLNIFTQSTLNLAVADSCRHYRYKSTIRLTLHSPHNAAVVSVAVHIKIQNKIRIPVQEHSKVTKQMASWQR